MGKNEVIVEVAKGLGIAQKDVKEVVEKFLDGCIASIAALKPGEKFSISGIGAWHMKETKARQGRNPKTGAPIQIPASQRVAFKAAKGLKEEVKA